MFFYVRILRFFKFLEIHFLGKPNLTHMKRRFSAPMKQLLAALVVISYFLTPVQALDWPEPPEGYLPGGKLGTLLFPETDTNSLGVNTRLPQGKLQVQENSYAGTGLVSSSGLTITGNGTSFTTELEVGDQIIIASQTKIVDAITDGTTLTIDSGLTSEVTDLAFKIAKPLFIVTPSGNVGIGTVLPQNDLDVQGNAVIGSGYAENETAPTDGLLIEGTVGVGTVTPQSKVDIEGNVSIGSTYSGTTAAPADGLLVEGTTGIGTMTPQSKLDVEGNVSIGSTYSGTTAAPTDGMIVEGVVGIGTNNPTINTKLEVIGNTRIDGTLESTGTASINELELSVDAIAAKENGDLNLQTWETADGSAQDRITIHQNGNVGINTSLPEGKLQIQGDATTGTGTISSVGVNVTGDTTSFLTELEVGAQIIAAGQVRSVILITDNTHLTLNAAFSTDLIDASFETALTRFQVQENGDTLINGNLEVTGAMDLTGSTTFTGQITADGGVITGSDIVSDTDSTDSLGSTLVRWLNIFIDMITTNKLIFDGDTGVNELVISDNLADGLSITDGTDDIIVVNTTTGSESVNITPNTIISSATQSTNKDSGALVVEGGAGVEKDLNVGGVTRTTGGLVIQKVTGSDPTTPEDGQIWLRTDL